MSIFADKRKSMEDRNYKVCTRCVMDTTDPVITFDEQGVCDHCHDFDANVKPNWHTDEKGKQELNVLIKKIKDAGKGKEFDCLLGLSGGLDSSYMLHMAVRKFGLRPLVFHVDGGWNSELAVHNINVMIDKLGLDLYTEVINWEEMKNFQLALFKSGMPHLDMPQDHAFFATMYHFAEKHNIPYILNGGNFSTECVQYPMEWFYYATDIRLIKDVLKQFGTRKMDSYPFSSVFRHKIYLKYLKGVHVVKPLNHHPFLKKEAISLLENEYNWRSYPQKHFESRFTKFFEGYWLPERFGYDTRRVQLSSLILTNQMSRAEAMDILAHPSYDPATIDEEFSYIATKLGITSEELRSYFTMPKKYYWDYKNQQNLFRLGAVMMNWLGIEKVVKRKK